MEYIASHGVYADILVDLIVAAWQKTYGKDPVDNWMTRLEERTDRSLWDSTREEVLMK